MCVCVCVLTFDSKSKKILVRKILHSTSQTQLPPTFASVSNNDAKNSVKELKNSFRIDAAGTFVLANAAMLVTVMMPKMKLTVSSDPPQLVTKVH